MQAITVYCASSPDLDHSFHEVAESAGRAIARRGLELVYGGGSIGLMGEIARAVRGEGARTIGIITELLVDRELADEACSEMIVVKTMRRRKQLLAERGDAFLVLPGGIGTYEEFFEILVARKLLEHDKRIGVVNCHGYYNPLVAMIEHGRDHGFIGDEFDELAFIHPDVEVVMEHLTAGMTARMA
jgi:uncharacterized protein (TIGR00730 family)